MEQLFANHLNLRSTPIRHIKMRRTTKGRDCKRHIERGDVWHRAMQSAVSAAYMCWIFPQAQSPSRAYAALLQMLKRPQQHEHVPYRRRNTELTKVYAIRSVCVCVWKTIETKLMLSLVRSVVRFKGIHNVKIPMARTSSRLHRFDLTAKSTADTWSLAHILVYITRYYVYIGMLGKRRSLCQIQAIPINV